MEFPDDTTWVLKFDKPQYIMPYILAQGFWEWEPLMKPAHFLKQFHPNYDGKAGNEGYTELDLMDRWFQTPGYPCLMAWCLKEYTAGETWVLERNPYYWKVDTEGNQLPYIDQIRVELVEDTEVRKLQVAQGRYDCVFRYNQDPTDVPFLLENAEAGDFRLVDGWMNGAGAWPGVIVNQDYHTEMEYDPATESEEDKEIRALLRNPDFLRGLSYAMNRQRVLDVAWDGIGDVKNFTISPQSPHFTSSDEGMQVYEEWAQAYAEYDPEKAKEHFDAAGFKDADGDGIRDLPSGTPFTLILQLNDWSSQTINTAFVEVYKLNLEDVGVKVLIDNAIGTADGGTNRDNGLFMLATTHASELDLWTYPDWVFPVRGVGEGTRAFPQQGQFYKTGGEQGWEPEPGSPAALLQDLYRQGLQEPDEQKRHEIIWEAVKVYIEQGPFIIGATGDQPMPVVCKNYFKNVYEFGVLGPWAPGTPGNTHPEQFYIDK
jgi:peptide/nickel transport system substrate-binding protein